MKIRVMHDLSAYRDYYGFDGLGRAVNAACRQIEAESF